MDISLFVLGFIMALLHHIESLEDLKLSIAQEISSHNKSERVNELLALSIGRVLINAYKKGKLEIEDYEMSTGFMSHVADWIDASVVNDAEWLKNVDELNRPKKLMKFNSWQQISNEADKDMDIFAQQNKHIILNEKDEKLIAKLEDGFYIVQLLTAEALDRESGQMQHCIGQGSYDVHLNSDERQFLSLRDSSGNPHVTMDLVTPSSDEGKQPVLKQIQGKQNKVPLEKYINLIKPYLKEKKVDVQDALSSSYIIDNLGEWHNIYNLPDILDVKTFNIRDRDAKERGFLREIKIPHTLLNTTDFIVIGFKYNLPENYPSDINILLYEGEVVDPPKELKTDETIYLYHMNNVVATEVIEAGKMLEIQNSSSENNELIFPNKIMSKTNISIAGHLPDQKISMHAENIRLRLGGTIDNTYDQEYDIVANDTISLVGSRVQKTPKGMKAPIINMYGTTIEEIQSQIETTKIDIINSPVSVIAEDLSDDILIVYNENENGIPLGECRDKVVGFDISNIINLPNKM